ncbi:hypothetical protein LEP1GSC188_1673 [Leptospira weilii serovar Topaz str. LT2116]|uniref:Uncharacterized protein n=1 Tax=Leptospira weilii serovar Topaz str. LT2116 TaxID=1088540 RepID=M3GZH8_9LEPT|nr:hypothetical protein LEP1GSC188_1673 [Leptospira weilii serovar Topaz str. LT2116]
MIFDCGNLVDLTPEHKEAKILLEAFSHSLLKIHSLLL